MSVSNAWAAPMNVGLPPSSRARRRAVPQARGRELSVCRHPATALSRGAPEAALPRVRRWSSSRRHELHLVLPTATPRCTEVVWDQRECKLHVGVWARPVREGHEGSEPHGRLLWCSSFWIPDGDGARAQARLEGAHLHVVVPRS